MNDMISTGVFDKDNKYAKIKLNLDVYSLQAIYAAGYIFIDKAYILLNKIKEKEVEVYLFARNKEFNFKELAMEFYNELLNYSHYFSRVETNSSVIKTIMQRVLFSVNPKFTEEAEEQEIQDLLKELEKEEPKITANSRVKR